MLLLPGVSDRLAKVLPIILIVSCGCSMLGEDVSENPRYVPCGLLLFRQMLARRDIPGYAAQMLAPGGRMVYSTCTFSPEENEG